MLESEDKIFNSPVNNNNWFSCDTTDMHGPLPTANDALHTWAGDSLPLQRN